MKLIFSDLDETLLSANWHVPEINLAAIRAARSAGHKFIPCSGRPPFMMHEIQRELECDGKPGEYSVYLNGALIAENATGRIIYSNTMDIEEVQMIANEAGKAGLCVMLFSRKDVYLFNPDPTEIVRKRRQGIPVILRDSYDVSELAGEPIGKVMMLKADGIEYLKEFAAGFPKELLEKYVISYSSGRFLEVNRAGVTKGAAVRALADYLGVSVSETISIGDSYNDLSMIREAGIGCAVANAHPDIKAVADYICRKNCEEGAVAEVIEKFVL